MAMAEVLTLARPLSPRRARSAPPLPTTPRNGRARRLGGRDPRAHAAGRRALGGRLARRERLAAARTRRRGQAHQAEPRVAPRLVPGALAPQRRRPHRSPHLHRLGARGGRRAHQQLGRPGRDAREDGRDLRGLDARPHDVRRAVLDGSRRRTPVAHRRADHRQRLRRRIDRHHDPRGRRGHPPDRRGRAVGQDGALRRCSAGGRRTGRRVALQRRQVHRALPGDARGLLVRLGLRWQRHPGEEVLRAAHRLGDRA